jgi:hypothetical protein
LTAYSLNGIPVENTESKKVSQSKDWFKLQIEKSPNQIEATAVAYFLCRDSSLLYSLEEYSDSDPAAVVLLFLISKYDSFNDAHREGILRRGFAKFPNDPLIAILLAGVESKARNYSEAIKLLQGSADDGPILLGSLQRQKSLREMMISAGNDINTAWWQSTIIENKNLYALSGSLISLIPALRQSKNLPETDRLKLATRIAEIGRSVNPFGGHSEINALVALYLESTALKLLPPDTDYDETGKSVAQRIADIKNTINNGRFDSMKTIELLEQNPNLVSGFFETREKEGTPAATVWLKHNLPRE